VKKKNSLADEKIIEPISYTCREETINSLRSMWPCREARLMSLVDHLSPFALIPPSSRVNEVCHSYSRSLLLQGPAGCGKKGLLRGVLGQFRVCHIWIHCEKVSGVLFVVDFSFLFSLSFFLCEQLYSHPL
jgi:hypothetical protein